MAAAAAVAAVERLAFLRQPVVGSVGLARRRGAGIGHLFHQVSAEVGELLLVEAVAGHLGARLEGVGIGEIGVEPAAVHLGADPRELRGAAVAPPLHRVARDAARRAEDRASAIVVSGRQLGRRQLVHALARRLDPQVRQQGLGLAFAELEVGHPGLRPQALGVAQPGHQPLRIRLLGQAVEVGRAARPGLPARQQVTAVTAGAADQGPSRREETGLGHLVAPMAGAAGSLGVERRQHRTVPVFHLAVRRFHGGGPALAPVAADAAEAAEGMRRVRGRGVEPEGLGGAGHPRLVHAEVAAHAAVHPVVELGDPQLPYADGLLAGAPQLARGAGGGDQPLPVVLLEGPVLAEVVLDR